jgi:hypothetical protein
MNAVDRSRLADLHVAIPSTPLGVIYKNVARFRQLVGQFGVIGNLSKKLGVGFDIPDVFSPRYSVAFGIWSVPCYVLKIIVEEIKALLAVSMVIIQMLANLSL